MKDIRIISPAQKRAAQHNRLRYRLCGARANAKALQASILEMDTLNEELVILVNQKLEYAAELLRSAEIAVDNAQKDRSKKS